VNRRKVLKMIAALAAAGVVPGELLAQDWNKAAFDMKGLNDAMKALGAQSPAASDAIAIKAPEIAENGAVVPVAVESRLPNTESISLLIEKNPQQDHPRRLRRLRTRERRRPWQIRCASAPSRKTAR
jgi:sulfur-oxidizing protein SoxY